MATQSPNDEVEAVSTTTGTVIYRGVQIPIPLSTHSRYMSHDLSHVHLPKDEKDFLHFIRVKGMVDMAIQIDQHHEMKGLEPVDYDSMRAVFYHVCLQKYIEWDPKTAKKGERGMQRSFWFAINQLYRQSTIKYWERKKTKYPSLDCKGKQLSDNDDGLILLMHSIDEGSSGSRYEWAMKQIAHVDPDGSRMAGARARTRVRGVSQVEAIVVARRQGEMAAEARKREGRNGDDKVAVRRAANRAKKERRRLRDLKMEETGLEAKKGSGRFGEETVGGGEGEDEERGEGRFEFSLPMRDIAMAEKRNLEGKEFELGMSLDGDEMEMDIDKDENVTEPGFGFSIPIRGNRPGGAQ